MIKAKTKQYIARNTSINKHYTNELTLKEPNKYISLAHQFLQELKQDNRIRYCLFSIERGKHQNLNSFHFQGYLEFNKSTDLNAFKKKYQLSYCEKAKGDQQDNINYVKKTQSKIHDKFFEFGIPKKQFQTYNSKDQDIPKDKQLQEIAVYERIKDNSYQNFLDIERDFKQIFVKQQRGLKEGGSYYHPIKTLDVVPLKTIGIYGHSGIGKTTGTNNYLKANGYQSKDVTRKCYAGEIKVGFDLKDETKKVLGIEEVREDFPNHNKVIQLIDKKDYLPVKGSLIENNFELLIFNSLHSPQKVYHSLKIGNQIEVLRRLFQGNDSKVYHLIADSKNHNKLIDKTNVLPNVLLKHFHYQKRIKEELEELEAYIEGRKDQNYFKNEEVRKMLQEGLEEQDIEQGDLFKQEYSGLHDFGIKARSPNQNNVS